MKYKRHIEGKTNYRKRLKLIKSGKPRLVIRKFLKSITAQIIQYAPAGDKVLASAHTKELAKKYSWNAKRNTPSAYLLGILIASKARQKNINEAVPDTGFYPSVKGSIINAVIKGAVDNGLKVPHSEEAFPKIDRLLGKHTKYTPEELKTLEIIKSKIIKGA